MGLCFKSIGDENRAIACFLVAIKKSDHKIENPFIYKSHFYIGVMLMDQLKLFEAMKYFKLCFEFKSLDYMAAYYYTWCLYFLKAYQEAIDFITPIQ